MTKEREQAEALLEGEERGYARVGNTEVRKTDDLVKRLREADADPGDAGQIAYDGDTFAKAADALASLRDEVKRLQGLIKALDRADVIGLRERNAALEEALRGIIARDWYDGDMRIAGPFAEIARAALDKK